MRTRLENQPGNGSAERGARGKRDWAYGGGLNEISKAATRLALQWQGQGLNVMNMSSSPDVRAVDMFHNRLRSWWLMTVVAASDAGGGQRVVQRPTAAGLAACGTRRPTFGDQFVVWRRVSSLVARGRSCDRQLLLAAEYRITREAVRKGDKALHAE
jgi:hypothetical protein